MYDYISTLRNGKIIEEEVDKEVLDCYTADYNCAGFALGLAYWYLPYYEDGEWESKELDKFSDSHWELFDNEGKSYSHACTGRGRIMVNYMTEQLPFIREIHNKNELKKNEYLVLFRASGGDFHYLRKMSDGTWAHKMGGQEIQYIDKKELERTWHLTQNNYQGKVYMLAVSYNHDPYYGYEDRFGCLPYGNEEEDIDENEF